MIGILLRIAKMSLVVKSLAQFLFCTSPSIFVLDGGELGALGHIGFDLQTDGTVYISRVCRGESGVPGLMGAAITALCDLLFTRYDFTEVFLDCYDTSTR